MKEGTLMQLGHPITWRGTMAGYGRSGVYFARDSRPTIDSYSLRTTVALIPSPSNLLSIL
jgi:hypothetical protein